MSPTPSGKPVRHILALSGGKDSSALIRCFSLRRQTPATWGVFLRGIGDYFVLGLWSEFRLRPAVSDFEC